MTNPMEPQHDEVSRTSYIGDTYLFNGQEEFDTYIEKVKAAAAEEIYKEFTNQIGGTGLITVEMNCVQVTGELTRLLRRIANTYTEKVPEEKRYYTGG